MRSVHGYTIEEELARGGAGVVFRARDPRGQRVALKVLQRGGSAGNVARFRREVAALARLRHPGIVRLRDAGVTDFGQRYLVLDFVEGDTLAARLERGPLPVSYAVELLSEVARALEAAHRQGILHRDVKPANVLLTPEGRPRLTDFGLAVDADGGHSLTASGAMLGTPGYMPPEQGMGELDKLGPPADVYGLGATLYASLCGRPPFEGEPLQVLTAASERDPEPPSAHRAQVSPTLDAICLRCLERDPARRYADAGELAVALEGFLSGEDPQVAPPRRSGSRAWILGPLAGVALAGAVVAVVVWSQRMEPAADPQPPTAAVDTPSGLGPELFARLDALEQAEDPQGALAVSEPLLERFPDHPRLLAHVGRERCMLDQMQRGLPLLERAVELDPRSADAWRFLAIACLAVDNARALAAIECSLQLAETPQAYAVRARALVQTGDLDGADRDLLRAEALDPDYRHLDVTRAVWHLGKGQLQEADALLSRLLETDPTASRYLMRAQIRRAAKAPPERVLADLEAALARRSFPQAIQARATLFTELGRYAEAERDWTRYLEFKPRTAIALCYRALLRARHLDRDAEALEDAELARSMLPSDFSARHALAMAFHHAGRDRESLQLLDALIEEAPTPSLHAQRAQLRFNLGDYAGAYADAMLRLRERRDDLIALELAALSATLQGRSDAPALARRLYELHPEPDQAFENLLTAFWHAEDYEAMLAVSDQRGLASHGPNALAYRGGALMRVGRTDEAAELLNRILGQDPRSKLALAIRSELYLAREDYARALSDAEAFLALAPTSSTGHRLRAEARLRVGDLEGARADLAEFERIAPRQMRRAVYSELRRELLAKLAELEGR